MWYSFAKEDEGAISCDFDDLQLENQQLRKEKAELLKQLYNKESSTKTLANLAHEKERLTLDISNSESMNDIVLSEVDITTRYDLLKYELKSAKGTD